MYTVCEHFYKSCPNRKRQDQSKFVGGRVHYGLNIYSNNGNNGGNYILATWHLRCIATPPVTFFIVPTKGNRLLCLPFASLDDKPLLKRDLHLKEQIFPSGANSLLSKLPPPSPPPPPPPPPPKEAKMKIGELFPQ